MVSTDPGRSGASRIRSAYARRLQTIPKNQYSIFSEAEFLRQLQLQRKVVRLLRRMRHSNLETEKVLEIGCGKGFWLRQLIQWGAKPENLFGIDLLDERIQEGRDLCPPGVTLQCGDASRLQFEDNKFDLILQFTVFTSILDPEMKTTIATEMGRVLKRGGAIVWYDFFISNPKNPDVRGVTRKEIRKLFPGFSISLQRITLAPPIGRAVGSISPALYRLLSACKPLCTHYVGFLQRP